MYHPWAENLGKEIDEDTGKIKRLMPHSSIDEEQIAFIDKFNIMNVLITSETEMSDD